MIMLLFELLEYLRIPVDVDMNRFYWISSIHMDTTDHA